MGNEEHQESTGDWASRLEKGYLTGKDLYALLDRVIYNQNKLNPFTRLDVKFSKPTDVYLKWKRGVISMYRLEPEESELKGSEPFDRIHVLVDMRGRGDPEDFGLRKYPDGEVKGFWYRNTTYSILLDEDFGDELVEVPLTSDRVKRIGQVIISAHATTIASLSSR